MKPMRALAIDAGFDPDEARALFGPARGRIGVDEFPFATEGDRVVATALARAEALLDPRPLLEQVAILLGGCNRSALLGPRCIAAPYSSEGRHPPVITSRTNAGHLLAGRAGLVIDLGSDAAPSWGRQDGRKRA